MFTLNAAGDESIKHKPLVPRPVVWSLIGAAIALLAWLALPNLSFPITLAASTTFAQTVWHDRSLDTLLQLVLLFSAVLGVLGLLSEEPGHLKKEHHT